MHDITLTGFSLERVWRRSATHKYAAAARALLFVMRVPPPSQPAT